MLAFFFFLAALYHSFQIPLWPEISSALHDAPDVRILPFSLDLL